MTPPAAAAAPSVRPRRAPAPRSPRRVSGPATRAGAPASVPRRAGAGVALPRQGQGLLLGALSALEALAQHRLLDRLIRGRVWIGLVAFALIGIVTLQLGLLELNGGIGRALEREAALQRENTALSIENSQRAAGTHVESGAAGLGMSFVPVGELRFLTVSPHADQAKAAAALSAAAAHAAERASEASASESSASSEAEGSGETEPAGAEGGSGERAAGAEASSEEGASAEASAGAGSAEEASASRESEAPSESSSEGSEAPAG